jgi:hypothetical protein
MFGKHWAEHQKSSFSKGIHFSLVWFCVALNSMLLLNTIEMGYKLNTQNKRRLSHLLSMEDVQLHGETQEKLHSLIDTVIIFGNNIKMTLGFDSYTIINIRQGEVKHCQKKCKDIEEMQPEDTYKYLGYHKPES